MPDALTIAPGRLDPTIARPNNGRLMGTSTWNLPFAKWPLLAAMLLSACQRSPPEAAERDLDSASGVAVLPTLDSPIPAGKSAVWCASFGIAWRRLAQEVMNAPPLVRGAEDLCGSLNRQASAEDDLPEGSFYAAAGWAKDGIADRIRREMAARFPAVTLPEISGHRTLAVAYAYLEARVKFPIPFFDNREALVFKDSSGRRVGVASFGLRKEDEYAYKALREQVEVLFADEHPGPAPMERFAIDLCSTCELQVVLARVSRGPTLKETLASLDDEIARFTRDEQFHRIGIGSHLLIPSMAFKIIHRFRELEGPEIEEAIQAIRFRLDRSGAEMSSEARIAVPAAPRDFIFDAPFVLYLKKRDGRRPFFAAWIDGPELLQPW